MLLKRSDRLVLTHPAAERNANPLKTLETFLTQIRATIERDRYSKSFPLAGFYDRRTVAYLEPIVGFRRDTRPRRCRRSRAGPCLRVFRPTPVSLGKNALWVGSRGARAPVSRREGLCLAYTAPLVVAASIRSFNNGMMSVDSFSPIRRNASVSGGLVSSIARVRPFAP
jgi:hypothetical protein